MSARRVPMRERVAPEQRWERRRDRRVLRVRQVWRTDRQVLLVDDCGERLVCSFEDLRRRFRQVRG